VKPSATPDPSSFHAEFDTKYPGVFHRPREERLRLLAFWSGALVLIFLGFWRTGFFNWQAIWLGIGKVGTVIAFMLPPAHNGWLSEFLYAILETV
jgi:hypothetical protein